jgi:hypothetical protein
LASRGKEEPDAYTPVKPLPLSDLHRAPSSTPSSSSPHCWPPLAAPTLQRPRRPGRRHARRGHPCVDSSPPTVV